MLLRIKNSQVQRYLRAVRFSTKNDNSTKASSKEENKKKISNSTFLKYELSQNPEFDKAFPHLSHYKPETTIRKDTGERDFVESLFNQNRVNPEKTYEETLHENYKKYVEGYKSPQGPNRWLSEEERAKINDIADAKLQELEDTGLSREELLYDGATGGLPLARDPFFQFIKKNRLAREMLLKPGEEFTVQKVIDLALNQDIGPDPALSRRKKPYLHEHEIDDETRIGFAKGVIHDKSPFKSDNYFSEYQQLASKQEDMIDPNVKKHPLPKTRSQLKRETFRAIDWLDIHWRNTELLTKFMNPAGKLKNHYQTRLPKAQQKRIAKVVKHARQLLLLPYVGYVKPTDRKSLRTLQEDIEDFAKRKINIETGQIYLDSGEKVDSENPYEIEDPTQFDEKGFENIKDLEFEYLPVMPTSEEINILEAQQQAIKLKAQELKKQGIDVEKLKQLYHEQTGADNLYNPKAEAELDPANSRNFEESFSKFEEKTSNLSPRKLIEAFLAEKAVAADYLQYLSQTENTGSANKATKEEVLKEIESIKRELGI